MSRWRWCWQTWVGRLLVLAVVAAGTGLWRWGWRVGGAIGVRSLLVALLGLLGALVLLAAWTGAAVIWQGWRAASVRWGRLVCLKQIAEICIYGLRWCHRRLGGRWWRSVGLAAGLVVAAVLLGAVGWWVGAWFGRRWWAATVLASLGLSLLLAGHRWPLALAGRWSPRGYRWSVGGSYCFGLFAGDLVVGPRRQWFEMRIGDLRFRPWAEGDHPRRADTGADAGPDAGGPGPEPPVAPPAPSAPASPVATPPAASSAATVASPEPVGPGPTPVSPSPDPASSSAAAMAVPRAPTGAETVPPSSPSVPVSSVPRSSPQPGVADPSLTVPVPAAAADPGPSSPPTPSSLPPLPLPAVTGSGGPPAGSGAPSLSPSEASVSAAVLPLPFPAAGLPADEGAMVGTGTLGIGPEGKTGGGGGGAGPSGPDRAEDGKDAAAAVDADPWYERIRRRFAHRWRTLRRQIAWGRRAWRQVSPGTIRLLSGLWAACGRSGPQVRLRFGLADPCQTGMLQGTIAAVAGAVRPWGITVLPMPHFGRDTVWCRTEFGIHLAPYQAAAALVALAGELDLWIGVSAAWNDWQARRGTGNR